MGKITDQAGNAYEFKTLEVSGTHLVLDGWHSVDGPLSAYTVEGLPFADLTPMQLYMAFTPFERIAIKSSTDPIVLEFWDTYQRAERTDTPINPNSASVLGGLAYLAGTPIDGHTIAAPILASPARIAQIQAGLAQ